MPVREIFINQLFNSITVEPVAQPGAGHRVSGLLAIERWSYMPTFYPTKTASGQEFKSPRAHLFLLFLSTTFKNQTFPFLVMPRWCSPVTFCVRKSLTKNPGVSLTLNP